jgi:hypothetical protein
MPAPIDATLLRLVRRIQRRLFLQRLGKTFAFLCPAALVLMGVVLLILANGQLRSDAWSLDSETFLVRAIWVGGSVGIAVVLSLLVAWWFHPSRRQAALMLDESFALKERISTCLELRPDEADSPAGQALLADTQKHIEKVHVPEAYPLTLSRRALLAPLALALTLLAALFCQVVTPRTSAKSEPVGPALKAELDNVSRALQEMAKEKTPPQGEKAPKGEALKQLMEEMNRLGERRPGSKEEARELLKDLTTLEDRLRKQEKAMSDRVEAMKQQAEEADRLRKKKKPDEQPTPREQALRDGDFSKAADELQRLSREMEKDTLSPEQREKMEKEMKDLSEQLERLKDVKEKDAKEREQQGGEEFSPEELEQMRQLDAAEAQALQELADELKEIEKALKEGKDGEAAEKLKKLAEKMGRLDPNGKQEDAARRLAQLQGIKERLGRRLGGNPAPASGKRPEKPEEDLKGRDTRAKGERSEGGIGGFRFLPGVGLREPKSPEQVQKLIDEAGREAAEAILRQRVQRGDADLMKGYFEKLRGDEPKK